MDKHPQDKAEQQQKWWQKNKRLIIITTFITLAFLIAFALAVSWFGWDWTGFNSGESKITKTPQGTNIEYSPGKTLWDWLALLGTLAIPLVVGFGAAWYSHSQQAHDQKLADERTASEKELADKRAAFEQEITMDRLREELLQRYFDDMSVLLLKEGLLTSEPFSPKSTIARARTLAVLHRVTATRKGLVLQFLHEAKLIDKDKRILDLRGADLSRADLRDADLRRADLSGTNLSEARLTGANLSEANLKDARNITTGELEKQVKSLKGATTPRGSIHP